MAIPTQLETVEQRIGALERQNRRLRHGLGITILLAAAAVLLGAAQGPADIDVTRLRLFDAAGKVRGVMSVSNGGPALILLDDAGKPRAQMGVVADGSPAVILYDANGKPRAHLGVVKDGTPVLLLNDSDGKPKWSQTG
jgi:hypothetical protein